MLFYCFVGQLWKILELWAGKAFKYSELHELLLREFGRSERNVNNGRLAYEVSKENTDPIRAVCVMFLD